MTTKSKNTPITKDQKTLLNHWEEYRGSIVMVVGDHIYSTKKAGNVDELVKKIEDEHHRRPLITYVPKEGTLVL